MNIRHLLPGLGLALALLASPGFAADANLRPHWISVHEWAVRPPPAHIVSSLRHAIREEQFKLSQNPNHAAALGKISVLQFTLGDYELAAASFHRLLNIQSTYPFAFAQYMQALYLSGDPDSVRFLLDRNIGQFSAPLPTEMLAAQLDYEAYDFALARGHLLNALEHLKAQEEELDASNQLRLKKVVLTNLIHASKRMDDEDGASVYRKVLAEISPAAPPSDETGE